MKRKYDEVGKELSVEVVPLTSEQSNRLKAEAVAAMNGEGPSCSLKAMSMSCFASEACAQNRHSSMNLDSLMVHKYKFVAIDSETERFVGCVSATPADEDRTLKHYFPKCKVCDDAIVLYNLCVSHSHRGRGAGRKLVDAILGCVDCEDKVYLLVSKLNLKEYDVEKLNIYKNRISKLLSLYDKFKFDVVDECEGCYLLRHK